jgi:hypothetical protein
VFVPHATMIKQDHALHAKLVVTLLMANAPFVKILIVLLATQLVSENVLPARMALLFLVENVSLVLTKTVVNVVQLVPTNVVLVMLAIWTPKLAKHALMRTVLPAVDQAKVFVQLVKKASLLKLDSVSVAKTLIAKLVLDLKQHLAQAAQPTIS